MTLPRISSVGFCAHYSRVGDWAFEYALDLSRRDGLQLNVFHFLSDPYDPEDDPNEMFTKRELAKLVFEKERELRMYYDGKLKDYLEVGFRLCLDDSWRELHRCLTGRQFQLLVLARPQRGIYFGGQPIEEFADRFVSPVVLVGPDSPDTFLVNRPAALLVDRFHLPAGKWVQVEADAAPEPTSP